MLWVFLQVKTVFNGLIKKTVNDLRNDSFYSGFCGYQWRVRIRNPASERYYSAVSVTHACKVQRRVKFQWLEAVVACDVVTLCRNTV
jgi:hypothetical protein